MEVCLIALQLPSGLCEAKREGTPLARDQILVLSE